MPPYVNLEVNVTLKNKFELTNNEKRLHIGKLDLAEPLVLNFNIL